MVDSDQQISYQKEQQHFRKTMERLQEILQQRLEKPRYYGDDFTEQVLDDMNERIKEDLKRAVKEPYFGRLDFEEDGSTDIKSYYIGKVGVMDDDSKDPLVIDWRAPLSSMFYSFSGDEDVAFYEAPEGIIEGTLHLKRNIVIRQQQLLRVVDSFVKGEVNLSGTDEFLLYKLGERKDNRLRDIVSTIQMEQNAIIRAPKESALIIQGVAGSGKTTVALHRLAYLLYQYREQVRPDRMMIFAPSTMFLDYISDVLPELGVGDIQQSTFTTWALNLLQDEVVLTDMAVRYQKWFENPNQTVTHLNQTAGRYKGSKRFKELIERYLTEYEQLHTPTKDFEAWEGQILEAETLQNWYMYEYRSYPLYQRKERILSRMKRWFESELKGSEEKHLVKERKKKANQRLRTFAKQWLGQTPLDIYQELFNPSKRTLDSLVALSGQIPESIRKETIQALKQKVVEYEDLAPLLLIQFRLNGFEKKDMFDHIVIDEAQDFSPLQIDLLKGVVRGSSFTILGDLAQGIHAYQGTLGWDEFQELFPREQTAYFELRQSYRSTMEIIQFANHMIDQAHVGVSKAIPVFRSGELVKLVQVQGTQNDTFLGSWIHGMQGQNYKSMAIVTKTEKEARRIHRELSDAGLSATLIDAKQQEYTGGVSVVPVYLTKGLEFDAVILVDVDETRYQQNDQDAKLLYVGCTRALHQLWLTHGEQPSALIKELNAELFERVSVQDWVQV